MAENPKPQPQPHMAGPAPDAGHVPITEELDRARWTLPPVVPILVAVAVVAIVVAVVFLSIRPETVATASIVKVASADQSGNTLVAVQVKVDNKLSKELWVRDLSSEVEMSDGKKYTDTAAPSVDAQRYLQAFPALKDAGGEPMRAEHKIAQGSSYSGFVIFAYPVDKATFDKRKSLAVSIAFYDHPSLVAKQ